MERPAAETSRALACQTCRLSKVKCGGPPAAGGVCDRCARLGLRCEAQVDRRRKRPRVSATTSAIARLGPAVRTYLQQQSNDATEQRSGAEAAVGALNHAAKASGTATELQAGVEESAELSAFPFNNNRTWPAFRDAVKACYSTECKLRWVRAAYAMARRNDSKEWAATIILKAGELGLRLDEIVLAMSDVAKAPPPELTDDVDIAEEMPDFVREVQRSPWPTLSRWESDGEWQWVPNRALRLFLERNGQRGLLERVTGVTSDPATGTQWTDLLASDKDRDVVMQAYAEAWGQLPAGATRTLGGKEHHLESHCSQPVRCLLGETEAGPFDVLLRIATRPGALSYWECMQLRPVDTPEVGRKQPQSHRAPAPLAAAPEVETEQDSGCAIAACLRPRDTTAACPVLSAEAAAWLLDTESLAALLEDPAVGGEQGGGAPHLRAHSHTGR